MKNFFNKLVFLLRNIFTKKALIYIIIFLILIILKSNKVNAFSVSDLCYQDLPQEKVNQVFDFIYDNIGYYDSYLGCCYWGNVNGVLTQKFRFIFYNQESTNPLYITSPGSNWAYNYLIPITSNDNIYYVVLNENFNIESITNNFNDLIGIRNYFDSDPIVGSDGRHLPNPNYNCIVSNRNIYSDSSLNSIFFQGNNISASRANPSIINWEDISSWNFSTLNISGGSEFQGTIPERSSYTLYIYYGDYYSSLNIKPYMEYTDVNNHIIFNIPRQQLITNYNIQGNESLHFVLKSVYTDPHTNNTITDNWDLGTYTLSLSSSDVDIINSNSSKQELSNINNSIQNQTTVIEQQTQVIEQQTQAIEDNTQATEHLENTITDSSIESGADDLPSIDVSDPSATGIDNIFQSIYNAFCTGEAQDIVFPIPFTNKNITLSPYYVRDMLNNNGANWVYLLIQAFWGYLIGRYIVKDISHKITKIKGGDIENIENNNIKEEML